MRTSSGQPVLTQPQPTASPAGSAASRLQVSLQSGSSLTASNGGLLLQGLCPEASVRPDAASGGCILGLRCRGPPASFLEVAVGKVRWHSCSLSKGCFVEFSATLTVLCRRATCTLPHSVCPAPFLARSSAAAASWRSPAPSCTG